MGIYYGATIGASVARRVLTSVPRSTWLVDGWLQMRWEMEDGRRKTEDGRWMNSFFDGMGGAT